MAESSTRLIDLRVHQQTNDDQILSWAPLGDLSSTIEVYARYAETAPEELVMATVASARFVRITGLRLRDNWRTVIYRVLLTDSAGDTREYDNVRLDGGPPSGPVKGLRLNVRAALRLMGTPVLVYQRISAKGTRCDCYDPVLKDTTIASCPDCFGTGWVQGYHPPILTLAAISPESESTTPGDTERQEANTQIMMADYPKLRPKDLIYEIGTGRRYRVGPIQPYSYVRELIHQDFMATRLNPNDVEHKITVPPLDTLEPLMSRVDAPHGRRTIVSANEGEAVSEEHKLI